VARASEQTDLRDGRKIAASSKKFCFSEKIYLPFFGNIWLSRRRPDPARGAFGQSSPNAVRDAMDAFIRQTCGVMRTAKACGSGTPGLVLSLRDVSQTTVTNKVMDTGESTQ
jgi:hypothetical protein